MATIIFGIYGGVIEMRSQDETQDVGDLRDELTDTQETQKKRIY
jgi:hypothetical protein